MELRLSNSEDTRTLKEILDDINSVAAEMQNYSAWSIIHEDIVEIWRRYGTAVEIEANIYDKCERHENCTVEVLTNSVTGKTSVGWWENE